MKEYTVVYIKDLEDYDYDAYKPGITIKEIIEGITCQMNRYGVDVDFDEIAIFEMYGEDETLYYKVVNIDGKYQLEAEIMYTLKAIGERVINGELVKREIYISAPTIDECFEELVKYKCSTDLYIKVDSVYLI